MRLLTLLGILAVSLAAVPRADAQEKTLVPVAKSDAVEAPYRQRHALCIGVSKYPNLPPERQLSYADDDARALAELLKEDYGYDSVRVLVDAQATRKGISDAISDLTDPKRVGRDDSVLIYFSGHGQTVKPERSAEIGFLVPHDARVDMSDVSNPSAYRRTCLRMDDLRQDADLIPARHVLFLVDACYSGYAASKTISKPTALTEALRYPARQIITAGTTRQEAYEHNAWGHGAFTYKLLETLRIERDPLSASKLGARLIDVVPRAVESRFPGKTLTPKARYLSGEGDYYFFRGSAGATPPAPSVTPSLTPSAWEQELAREREREALKKRAESAFTSLAALESRPAQSQAEADKRLRFWQGYLSDYAPAGHRLSEARGYVKQYESWTSGPKLGATKTVDLGGGVELTLVWIEGGSFEMGSRLTPAEIVSRYGGKESYYTDERPVHRVTVDGFWMGRTEITNAQYRRFQSSHSSKDYKGHSLNGDTQPVVYVSWDDAQAYCKWLSGRTGLEFRLPREAEWEFACRAGTTSVRYWGDDDASMGRYANTYDRTGKVSLSLPWDAAETTDEHIVTAPVGSFTKNAWGLHDMIGNVYEWCEDWYGEDYYSSSPSANPKGASSGSSRVLRGGSWNGIPGDCRSADRGRGEPDSTGSGIGFRVVCISPGLK